MTDASQACMYLYRSTTSAQIRYVGRGTTPDRALQHTGGSHNEGLRALIETGNYTLEVAGPYRSTDEAALVEAALISALERSGTQAALANLVPGSGPRFRPLGVPGELAGRPLEEPLTLAQIGRLTGGALLVRNSFGATLCRTAGLAWTRCRRTRTGSSSTTSLSTGCCDVGLPLGPWTPLLAPGC
jgi:hypothetical protein